MADEKLVRMVRDRDTNPAPFECDCHPSEVGNYMAGGWMVADPLDHDGDGKKGGSKRKAKASQDEEAGEPALTRREIEADLTAAGADFDPAADVAVLREQRDAVKGA